MDELESYNISSSDKTIDIDIWKYDDTIDILDYWYYQDLKY